MNAPYPTVPIASNGLEGFSSCCGAAVTYHDADLCCKRCWEYVETVALEGADGVELGRAISAHIAGTITYREALAVQKRLLARQAAALRPVVHRPALTIRFDDVKDRIVEEGTIARNPDGSVTWTSTTPEEGTE